jgi:hypothetical protein
MFGSDEDLLESQVPTRVETVSLDPATQTVRRSKPTK